MLLILIIMKKHTKIIATIGPASDSIEVIRALYESGMNVARLNFSHGNYDYFSKIIDRIREVSEEIAIMLDTKGPEIRTTSCLDGNAIELKTGQEIDIIASDEVSCSSKLSINYHLLEKITVGTHLFLDDGLIEAEVIESCSDKLRIRALNEGLLGSNKSVTIQGHNLEIPFLSDSDKNDILFGIEKKLDYVAASYVRSLDDVKELQDFLSDNGSNMNIISKIEHWNTFRDINKIIELSDAIMVARGDLGVEISIEKVPLLQRNIILSCNKLGRPVIVATQMLESMTKNPRPTRAEVSDVAHAILQGADAIMLSGETASGKYPVESVKMMNRIARAYDKKVKNVFSSHLDSKDGLYTNEVSLFVTKAAYMASKSLNTGAILTLTESGYTAKKVSRFKPKCPILAITRDMTVLRQLQLSWGVVPIYEPREYSDLNQYIDDLVFVGYKRGYLAREDVVVITAGHKLHREGTTNILKVYYVEDVLKRAHKAKDKEHIL